MTGLPSRDWTRPYGIPFDRSQVPPDDELQDEICRVNGELDGLAATQFCLSGGGQTAGPIGDHDPMGPANGGTP